MPKLHSGRLSLLKIPPWEKMCFTFVASVAVAEGGFLIFFSVGEWKIKNRNRFHLEAAQDEKKWVKKIETAV